MRFPDQGGLPWHLGGAAPLGPRALAWGRLPPRRPSHPLRSSAPPPAPPLPTQPTLCPVQPNTGSPFPAGHRLPPVP